MKIHAHILHTVAVLFAACLIQAHAAAASLEAEVRAAFERFVQVQNARDAKALEGLLADSPQFLWITRGNVIWGREAALQRFARIYEGTWKLEPDLAAMRIVSLGSDAAQLHVPVVFTTGAPGQPAQSARMFLNQVMVKSGGTWRVMSIFPVPGPASP